jgi:hypothetical protein
MVVFSHAFNAMAAEMLNKVSLALCIAHKPGSELVVVIREHLMYAGRRTQLLLRLHVIYTVAFSCL